MLSIISLLILLIIPVTGFTQSDQLKTDATATMKELRELAGQIGESDKPAEIMDTMVKKADEFYKKYPDQKKEPYFYYVIGMTAERYDIDLAKKLYNKVIETGNEEWKERGSSILRRMGVLGKPLPIKFKSTDGRNIDLTKMKGKVVLVDFWATWCGPCVREIPNVVKAYKKYHDKGFEIVGISFDRDKESLDKMTKEQGMTWPQYFDGLYWDNKIGREYGISAIPTMWLLDKQGNVADLNARDDLEGKIAELLK